MLGVFFLLTVLLRSSEGHPVSTNIAPSTATVSVVHNAQFAAAYGGFPFFHPFEVAFQVRLWFGDVGLM